MAYQAKATEANKAGQADLYDKAAYATEANKVKATEADKADEDKANIIDKSSEAYVAGKPSEAEANETDEAKATEADKADEAKANEANKADDANMANEAFEADKADQANEAKQANEANEAKASEADEAIEADLPDKAVVLFFIIANIVIIFPRSLLDKGIVIILYSLTKYSAVFAKRKGYFGIMIFNNQRGCFLENWNDYRCNKIDATINLDV